VWAGGRGPSSAEEWGRWARGLATEWALVSELAKAEEKEVEMELAWALLLELVKAEELALGLELA